MKLAYGIGLALGLYLAYKTEDASIGTYLIGTAAGLSLGFGLDCLAGSRRVNLDDSEYENLTGIQKARVQAHASEPLNGGITVEIADLDDR